MQYPKRLIEVDLPIKRISAHARREKSIRHGHISTLHIWWARRPLAACRAVICASLWPDPADELCPPMFRVAVAETLSTFAEQVRSDATLATLCQASWSRWRRTTLSSLRPDDPAYWLDMRYALLDFIADFANPDASSVPAFLDTSRALTQAAHEALGGQPDTRPLVVDPFAGGGAIPLEALRIGADAFASDLNPVAVLLNKVVLDYIPRYGQQLADEVRIWGAWIKDQAERELEAWYPQDADGATPITYLWARTIRCEAPGCGAEVPLIRSLWLAKKDSRSVALRLVPQPAQKRVDFEIMQGARAKDVGDGTVRKGSATCPCCGFTTPVVSVRRQLRERGGGTIDARLFCVVTTRQDQEGRFYRTATEHDTAITQQAATELARQISNHSSDLSLVPNEQFTGLEPRRIPLPQYGMTGFGDLFSPRQSLTLVTFARLIRQLRTALPPEFPAQLAEAVQTALALCLDKTADLANTLCRWEPVAQCPRQLFARQALPMVWDFGEGVPIGKSSGSFAIMVERFAHVLEAVGSDWHAGQIALASATNHPLPDDSADAMITDPPYYVSVPYADLSDFFFVWMRRTIGEIHPELFRTSLTPKDEECVQNLPHSEVAHLQKSRQFYEQQMMRALLEGRRVAKPDAIGTVVFAHSDTDAWESLLAALITAGWCVTASWPIDTEMATRVIAQRQSTLASSVHLVCRPRENPDGTVQTDAIGDWRDVLQELPARIRAWMPRLAAEGVVGADAIFACLGPALEIFSRYSSVEKPNGDRVMLKEYLEHVWAAVAREALGLVFQGADATGFEPDARIAAMWLWTLSVGDTATDANLASEDEAALEDDDASQPTASTSGYVLAFDAARKIAQGLGADLARLDALVQVKGDTARLLPVSERTAYLFGEHAGQPPARGKKQIAQISMFDLQPDSSPDGADWSGDLAAPPAGATVLDRLHQGMILFGAGRGEALRRFLVDDGVGQDQRLWRLAQAFSALYPTGSDEKRWVDGVLGRKKSFGF